MELEISKIFWDFRIQTDQVDKNNRLDLVVVDKVQHMCFIVDVARPFGPQMIKKEDKKWISTTLLSMK